MAETNYTGILLVAFISIMVALAMFSGSGSIAENVNKVQTKSTATETVSIANARLANNAINASYYFHLTNGCPQSTGNWRRSAGTECYISVTSVKNSTGGTLTDPDDYVAISNGAVCTGTTSGDLRFVNSELMNGTITNTTTVTYTYCADGYVPKSQPGATSIISLILIMTALAIAAIALWAVLGGKIKEYLDL